MYIANVSSCYGLKVATVPWQADGKREALFYWREGLLPPFGWTLKCQTGTNETGLQFFSEEN